MVTTAEGNPKKARGGFRGPSGVRLLHLIWKPKPAAAALKDSQISMQTISMLMHHTFRMRQIRHRVCSPAGTRTWRLVCRLWMRCRTPPCFRSKPAEKWVHSEKSACIRIDTGCCAAASAAPHLDFVLRSCHTGHNRQCVQPVVLGLYEALPSDTRSV